jgi:hypothetical protein
MTSYFTIGRSKWVAAAVAMVFMVSVAAVCFDSASAAGDEKTVDVDETFATVFGLVSFLFNEEPSNYAKVISGSYDVDKNERYGELVLGDGAVLNFSNSARLIVNRLFIDGDVKIVNKDCSNPRLSAESVFFAGYKCPLTDFTFFTDKSVAFDVDKKTTGFYDLFSKNFDPSKGIEESLDVRIYTDGYIGLEDKVSGKVYSGNGSPAVRFHASYDLDGFYDSLKKSLDGQASDPSITSKISDYILEKMVYPEIDLGMNVAKVSTDAVTMSDVAVTFVSSQSESDIALGMSIGSSEGDLVCKGLDLKVSGSLKKTDVSGSAEHLVAKGTGSGVAATEQSAEFEDLEFTFSTMGSDILKEIADSILDGPQAVIDALADSDAKVSGSSHVSAGSVKGVGPVTVDGVAKTLRFGAEAFEYRADVDTAAGSAVKASVSVLDVNIDGNKDSQTLRMTDFSEDLTTNGKNVFGILKLVPFDEDPSETDYRPAMLEYLDGLSVKGGVYVGNFDMMSVSGTEGVDYAESMASINGNLKKNFESLLDLKFSADEGTGKVRIAGAVTPSFSDSAVGYGKTFVSDRSGVNGDEVTLSNIKVGALAVDVETFLDDIMNGKYPADMAGMKVAISADVVKNSWSTGEGSTAYAEKVRMGTARFDTTISDLMEFSTVDLPASSGGALSIDSYKASDRGTGPIMEFADVVSKADVSSTVRGSSYEFKYDESGKESLYIADTETIIDGVDVKYKEASDKDSVAYLVKNEAGYYEVAADGVSDSVPVYNVEGKEPAKGGDNTMLYIAIAVIAVILIALAAFFMLKKRSA